MYDVEKTLTLPVTATAQPSNLVRLEQGDQVYGAVIHKQQVNIVCITNPAPQPITVYPQLASRPFTITQARWVPSWSGRHVLVLTGYGGALLYDWDGGALLKVVSMLDGGNMGFFTRGITGLAGNIAIGCSTGEVIVLSSGDSYVDDDGELTSDSGDCGVGTELMRIKWRKHCVAALASTENTLAVGDVRGNITVGNIAGGGSGKMWDIESYGSALTCLETLGEHLLAGYVSGHIRIYDTTKERIIAEVCAHARAVTGMDVVAGVEEGEHIRAVTVGEDTFVRVWTLSTGPEDNKVSHVHSNCEENRLLTGVAFTDNVGNGYVTAAYDVPHLICHITS